MDLALRDKVVVVTGGSKGLGRDIAFAFAAEGARVVICARDKNELEAAAAEMRAAGGKCEAISADLSDEAQCRALMAKVAEKFNGLDVLVNNASTNVDTIVSSIEEMTDEQMLTRLRGKTMTAVRCSRAALPYLRKSASPRIVCISGTSARSVFRTNEAIVAGSSLVQGIGNSSLTVFAKHLAEETAASGIRVNVVHCHIVETGRHDSRLSMLAEKHQTTASGASDAVLAQIPIHRVLSGADVVPFVLLLASPLADGMTGQSVTLDGGALRAIPY